MINYIDYSFSSPFMYNYWFVLIPSLACVSTETSLSIPIAVPSFRPLPFLPGSWSEPFTGFSSLVISSSHPPTIKQAIHLLFLNIFLDKKGVVHIFNGILLNHKKRWNTATCNNMDGPWEYYMKRNKSDRKCQEPCDCTHVGYKTEGSEWRNKTDKQKLIDTENSTVVTRGKGGLAGVSKRVKKVKYMVVGGDLTMGSKHPNIQMAYIELYIWNI